MNSRKGEFTNSIGEDSYALDTASGLQWVRGSTRTTGGYYAQ